MENTEHVDVLRYKACWRSTHVLTLWQTQISHKFSLSVVLNVELTVSVCIK